MPVLRSSLLNRGIGVICTRLLCTQCATRNTDFSMRGGSCMSYKERRVLAAVLAIAPLLLFQSAVFAQSTSTGSVQGIVADQSGATVPDASVALTDIGTGATMNAQTDPSGNFSF